MIVSLSSSTIHLVTAESCCAKFTESVRYGFEAAGVLAALADVCVDFKCNHWACLHPNSGGGAKPPLEICEITIGINLLRP